MITPAHLTATRLSLFYAAHFAAIGILLPFWPVWLSAQGLSAPEIGLILAIGMGMKVFSSPLVAYIADRRGEGKGVIVVLAFTALLCFALFGISTGFWALFTVNMIFFALWPAVLPLAESLTMASARENNLDYGRIRLWGSVAFIIAAVLAGRALSSHGTDLIFQAALFLVALKALTALSLPTPKAVTAPQRGWLFIDVLRNKRFVIFLLACALVQSSHAVYYGFGTLHWQKSGLDEATIGWLWAEGVIAEILLFLFGAGLVRRFGPMGLIAMAAAAGMLRWPLLAFSTDLPVLVAAQALHAFTFGAAHLGAIHFISRNVPASLSSTAQAVYAAAVMGIAFSPAMFGAGALYDAVQGHAYLMMAVMAGGGLMLALSLRRQDI